MEVLGMYRILIYYYLKRKNKSGMILQAIFKCHENGTLGINKVTQMKFQIMSKLMGSDVLYVLNSNCFYR